MSGSARRRTRPLAIVAGVMAALAVINSAAAQTFGFGASASFASPEVTPFGLAVYQAPSGPLWVKWRGMDGGLVADALAVTQCRSDPGVCSPAARRFLAVVDEARGLDGRQRLGVINRAVNLAIRYTSDVAQHGVPDHWASPLATFASQQGDCEDYAIAKFLALREAGVAAEDLRLLLAHNRTANEAHAVLAARQDGRWLILDNRRMTLIDDEHSADLVPLFALDSAGVKQFAAPGAVRVASAAKPDVSPAAADQRDGIGGTTLPVVM